MPIADRQIRWVLALGCFVLVARPARAEVPLAPARAAALASVRDRAMASDWAYQRLADLTDLIGPRLSGTRGAEAAIEQVANVMRGDGLRVTLQPMRAPHWVRGEERAELVEYAGRPAGITQTLHVTALGGSVATPGEGLVAPVLVVRSFEELTSRAKEARGAIVLFDVAFDQELAENGQAGTAYMQAGAYRRLGATAAARVGAVAALVRSVGGASYRLTHTGQMDYAPDVAKIPAAALSAEDAMLIARLRKRGPLKLSLRLTPQALPEVDSFNVIGDLVGSEHPEQVVLVSGHLDSWDLATGAIDDGSGVITALSVAHVLKELKLRPKRTLRVVAFMSEEPGSLGGRAYFEANKTGPVKHIAVIEADFGAGRALGLSAYAAPSAMTKLEPLRAILSPIGATAQRRSEHPLGSDVGAWQAGGVPGFEALVDGRHYFDFHHTAADTFDKVDPKNLQRLVATLGVLVLQLLDDAEPPEGIASGGS